MKRLNIILLCLLVINNVSFAQHRDEKWLFGYALWNDNLEGINFLGSTPDTFQTAASMNFFATDASICDTAGNLLFYTNGDYIANKKNDSLQNSRNFNPGYMTQYFTNGFGYNQGAIILPFPEHDSEYYVFSLSGQPIQVTNYNKAQPLNLFYSDVNMSLDNGLGGVVDTEKAKSAVIDTLLAGYLTACKNGNGRDWWIIVHKVYSNLFYKVLLTPQGISRVDTQYIGLPINLDFYGRAVFSPDGSKYAIVWYSDSAEVLDFDRCAGKFSNPRIVRLPDTAYGIDNLDYLSCAISPDSRYLYANNDFDIWQVDMQNPDLASSIKLAGRYDSSLSSGFAEDWPYDLQLAPDNKIYISTYGASNVLDVINFPDSGGLKCNFIQSGYPIPNPNGAVPNFPNYDLGPLVGSGCDTLSSVNPIIQSMSLSVYPNPAREWLTIKYETLQNLQCQVFDITGRLITNFTLYPYFRSRMYDVSGLSQGIYILKVKDAEGISAARKFVKE